MYDIHCFQHERMLLLLLLLLLLFLFVCFFCFVVVVFFFVFCFCFFLNFVRTLQKHNKIIPWQCWIEQRVNLKTKDCQPVSFPQQGHMSRGEQTFHITCVLHNDSDQPMHLHSLIRDLAVRMNKPSFHSYPLSVQPRLWSVRADARVDLVGLCRVHMSLCRFCIYPTHIGLME